MKDDTLAAHIRSAVARALEEDLGGGDITTLACVPAGLPATGRVMARAEGVVAGLAVAEETFRQLDAASGFAGSPKDGDRVRREQVLAEVSGQARTLLSAERVALNFLCHLSGIATLTRRFVEAVEGLPAKILDTRKTTPGLRALEKYAVRCGGGHNHRLGLCDAVLIKDNHIVAAGGVGKALQAARSESPVGMRIEIEVKTLVEVEEALDAGAELLLLDNMSPETTAKAVRLAKGRAITEASGGVNLDNVRAFAETGVDFISIGALTHSAPALDISMELLL